MGHYRYNSGSRRTKPSQRKTFGRYSRRYNRNPDFYKSSSEGGFSGNYSSGVFGGGSPGRRRNRARVMQQQRDSFAAQQEFDRLGGTSGKTSYSERDEYGDPAGTQTISKEVANFNPDINASFAGQSYTPSNANFQSLTGESSYQPPPGSSGNQTSPSSGKSNNPIIDYIKSTTAYKNIIGGEGQGKDAFAQMTRSLTEPFLGKQSDEFNDQLTKELLLSVGDVGGATGGGRIALGGGADLLKSGKDSVKSLSRNGDFWKNLGKLDNSVGIPKTGQQLSDAERARRISTEGDRGALRELFEGGPAGQSPIQQVVSKLDQAKQAVIQKVDNIRASGKSYAQTYTKGRSPELTTPVTNPAASSEFLGYGGVVVDDAGEIVIKSGDFYGLTKGTENLGSAYSDAAKAKNAVGPAGSPAGQGGKFVSDKMNPRQVNDMWKAYSKGKLKIGAAVGGFILMVKYIEAKAMSHQQGVEGYADVIGYSQSQVDQALQDAAWSEPDYTKADGTPGYSQMDKALEIEQTFMDSKQDILEHVERDKGLIATLNPYQDLDIKPFAFDTQEPVRNKLTEFYKRNLMLRVSKAEGDQIDNAEHEYMTKADKLEVTKAWETAQETQRALDAIEFDRQNLEISIRQNQAYDNDVRVANLIHNLAMIRLAEQERIQKENQEFWLKYLEEKAKYEGSYTQSNLNFGGGLF